MGIGVGALALWIAGETAKRTAGAIEKLPEDTEKRLDEMEKSLAETNEIIQASQHLRKS